MRFMESSRSSRSSESPGIVLWHALFWNEIILFFLLRQWPLHENLTKLSFNNFSFHNWRDEGNMRPFGETYEGREIFRQDGAPPCWSLDFVFQWTGRIPHDELDGMVSVTRLLEVQISYLWTFTSVYLWKFFKDRVYTRNRTSVAQFRALDEEITIYCLIFCFALFDGTCTWNFMKNLFLKRNISWY